MTDKSTRTPLNQRTEKQIRDDRLKAALKANMGRRKAQAKAKARAGAENPDQSSEKGD